DDAGEHHFGPQRPQQKGHAGGPAETDFLRVATQHEDRRLRADAIGVAERVAIEDEIAENEDAGTSDAVELGSEGAHVGFVGGQWSVVNSDSAGSVRRGSPDRAAGTTAGLLLPRNERLPQRGNRAAMVAAEGEALAAVLHGAGENGFPRAVVIEGIALRA